MNLNNENRGNSKLIELLLDSEENIKATFEIVNSFDGLRTQIARYFVEELKNLLIKDGKEFEFNFEPKEFSYKINICNITNFDNIKFIV